MHIALQTSPAALSQGPRLISQRLSFKVPPTFVQTFSCLKDVNQTSIAYSSTSRLFFDVPFFLGRTSYRLKVVYPPESTLQDRYSVKSYYFEDFSFKLLYLTTQFHNSHLLRESQQALHPFLLLKPV